MRESLHVLCGIIKVKAKSYQAALLSQSNMKWVVTCTLGTEVCGYCIVPEMF